MNNALVVVNQPTKQSVARKSRWLTAKQLNQKKSRVLRKITKDTLKEKGRKKVSLAHVKKANRIAALAGMEPPIFKDYATTKKKKYIHPQGRLAKTIRRKAVKALSKLERKHQDPKKFGGGGTFFGDFNILSHGESQNASSAKSDLLRWVEKCKWFAAEVKNYLSSTTTATTCGTSRSSAPDQVLQNPAEAEAEAEAASGSGSAAKLPLVVANSNSSLQQYFNTHACCESMEELESWVLRFLQRNEHELRFLARRRHMYSDNRRISLREKCLANQRALEREEYTSSSSSGIEVPNVMNGLVCHILRYWDGNIDRVRTLERARVKANGGPNHRHGHGTEKQPKIKASESHPQQPGQLLLEYKTSASSTSTSNEPLPPMVFSSPRSSSSVIPKAKGKPPNTKIFSGTSFQPNSTSSLPSVKSSTISSSSRNARHYQLLERNAAQRKETIRQKREG